MRAGKIESEREGKEGREKKRRSERKRKIAKQKIWRKTKNPEECKIKRNKLLRRQGKYVCSSLYSTECFFSRLSSHATQTICTRKGRNPAKSIVLCMLSHKNEDTETKSKKATTATSTGWTRTRQHILTKGSILSAKSIKATTT